jgi:hypothetical protein
MKYFRAHSKTASIKTPVMKFKKSNLASANTPETKTASFKTAQIHNAYTVEKKK